MTECYRQPVQQVTEHLLWCEQRGAGVPLRDEYTEQYSWFSPTALPSNSNLQPSRMLSAIYRGVMKYPKQNENKFTFS